MGKNRMDPVNVYAFLCQCHNLEKVRPWQVLQYRDPALVYVSHYINERKARV